MNAKDAVKTALTSTQNLLTMYLGDLSDADLLVRPVPGANHLAWQIGHVTASEIMLVQSQLPQAVYPALPAGWAEAHAMAANAKDGPDGFRPKAEYVRMFNAVRKATIE